LGTLNPQDGTPAPSSPIDQLLSTTVAACSAPRAARSRANGFVLWLSGEHPYVHYVAPRGFKGFPVLQNFWLCYRISGFRRVCADG
jgi:hypothetical protein